MNYLDDPCLPDDCIGAPKILYRDDYFLPQTEIRHFQNLLHNRQWGLSNHESLDKIFYISQDLYRHYAWDGDWKEARWLDHTAPDWENLYLKISQHLPPHYVHWVDVKITGPLQGGTPIHRDKDPWFPGGDTDKFSRAISVLCNLNTEWDPDWGGGFVLYATKKINPTMIEKTVDSIVPILPGQLLIIENCYHSVELITEPCRSRISFILHVLQYNDRS